ncbi:MAG: NAD-dependent protein deacylase [Bacteroidetes bacterium GWF2_40_14]|nr:MAG: NAD-dependent protein deacylase [Bacteroidetes bacterium GWF2_40_14]
MIKKHLVVLSGAGVSADSGVETFRDANGLWAKHRVEDVCTPEALENNPELVLDFYNQRRRQLFGIEPNAGHLAIAGLEENFNVDVITQNVDNLHERAGSTKILHLHGELLKCRSMKDDTYIRDITGDLHIGDLCPKGGQLRPHIVFFGEQVPEMEKAEEIISTAEIVIVVGTSLAVYPASSLIYNAPPQAVIYVVDPSVVEINSRKVTYIRERSVTGLPKLMRELMSDNI